MTDTKNTTKNRQYSNLNIKELESSELEISASVPEDALAVAYKKVLKKLGETTKMDGFRRGHVPESILLRKFGEEYVLENAAQEVLSKVYPAIIASEKIRAIGKPQIEIKKLALGNPLEFTAKTAVMPEFELPDYDKIAKKIFSNKASLEVTDKDLEDALLQIRRQKAQIDSFEKQKRDGVEKPEIKEMNDEDLPELTGEFVKTLGDFKNIEEFTKAVRGNLGEEKKLKDNEKKRIAVMEEIIDQTELVLPPIMINSELARMQAQFESEIAQTGTKIEDYLKQIDKTSEELRANWRAEAEKRAKLQLILNEIAKKHSIKPQKEDVDKEVQHLLAYHKDADETDVHIFVETSQTNELVFKYLEELGENGKC